MTQPTLFDPQPMLSTDPHLIARRSDPATSHAAAEEIALHVSRLEEWAAECVKATSGLTQRELGDRYCPDDLRKIGRRLSGAERKGLIRRGPARKCSITGRSAETWWPV